MRKVTEFDKRRIFWVSDTSESIKFANSCVDSSTDDEICTMLVMDAPNVGSSGLLQIMSISCSLIVMGFSSLEETVFVANGWIISGSTFYFWSYGVSILFLIKFNVSF